jgi:hypothetical protein
MSSIFQFSKRVQSIHEQLPSRRGLHLAHNPLSNLLVPLNHHMHVHRQNRTGPNHIPQPLWCDPDPSADRTRLNLTAGRASALFAASRSDRSCGAFATERTVVTVVPGPNWRSGHDPTRCDPDPRGSFGSQKP